MLNLNDKIVPVVAESASYECSSWSQSIYLCAPKNESQMSCNNALTHVEWKGKNTCGRLLDLGLGYDNFDACIIVNDSKLHELLKKEDAII